MCMSLCGRKWGNADHLPRSYQLALFLPLQSFLPPYPGSLESLPQPTASFFFQLPTKVQNQCESLKKEPAQRTESQAKAPGCRLRKKLPLGKDLLPGFARLFFLGQTEFLKQTTGLQVGRAPLNRHPLRCEGWPLCCFSMLIFFVDVVFHFSRLRERKCERLNEKRGGEREEKKYPGYLGRMFLYLCISFLFTGSYLHWSSLRLSWHSASDPFLYRKLSRVEIGG